VQGGGMDQLLSRRGARVLQRESRIVREAIALVASGGARRVVIAGLRFGDDVVDPARIAAIEAGLRIRSLARASGSGIDLSIETIAE
jgi:hypothetical protein